MDEIAAQIEDMKARWMTGGSAETACPAQWRDALGDTPNLTLVALAGQFARIATSPSTEGLTARSPLPRLSLPTVAQDLRPLARRALEQKTSSVQDVLTLVAKRGFTVHPADWMPKASADVPDVYGPWIDWLSEDNSNTDDDELTAENWEAWMPHARKAVLAEMRRTNPAAARDLIAAKARDVPAEQRLRLMAVLRDGLSEDDIETLESFVDDRSSKVRSMVNNMLARLGRAKANKDALDEFADFFDLQKAGMLSRKHIIAARKLKTGAQRGRRTELANALPLAEFARALDLRPDDVIDNFELGEAVGDLIDMTAATGTTPQALRLAERLQANNSDADVTPLLARLDGPDRVDAAKGVAKRDAAAFQSTLIALGPELGSLDLATLQGAHAMKDLKSHLNKDEGRIANSIDLALANLGLIASQDAATDLLNHLTTQLGLITADPRLALLRLNASLSTLKKET